MTLEIAAVLAILATAFVLFVTERVRMDVVSLLVLSVLAVSGLVSPAQALSGFSNPAVVTVWAMFILSAGLTQTGVAEALGRRLLGLSGQSEAAAVTVVMLTSGILSAFMNNIGVAALMLPVVMSIARRTGHSPSRLLMPLAFGSLLGGLTTLIGTPPNLLVSIALDEAGHEPFQMFDFAPVGGFVLVAGCLFVVLIGRRMLPQRDLAQETRPRHAHELRRAYGVDQLSVALRLPAGSPLVGKPLHQTRLGRATGLAIYAIVRNGEVHVAPNPSRALRAEDRLLVHGSLDRFNDLRAWNQLDVQRRHVRVEEIAQHGVGLQAVRIGPESELVGSTIAKAELRRRLGVMVVAVKHARQVALSGLEQELLAAGDELLLLGSREALERSSTAEEMDFEPGESRNAAERYGLADRLFSVRVPRESMLVGSTLLVSRLGDALGAGVLALKRDGVTLPLPSPEETLHEGDELIVRGDPSALESFRGLQQLEVQTQGPGSHALFESKQVRLVEVMLSPHSTLAGRTLRELNFRERYGVHLLAILRGGEVQHSDPAQWDIRLGDAMLCVAPPDRAEMLGRDPDFLTLNVEAGEGRDKRRAFLSAGVMLAVVVSVLLGALPIALAAIAGATLMVLLGCLSMEQAYRSIEWRSVFLIAGMLPLGIAMAETGAAAYLARGIVASLGTLGPWGAVVGLYAMTALLTSVVPTAALVVLVSPIALDTSARLGLSEHAVLMAIAMAASASFTSPISHPANVLVMGPGGYRFADYVKLGLPLTLVVMVVVLLVLPIFWPLQA